jgi:transcriptional repressor NrdR
MRCPACGHTDSRVLESRSAESGQSIRRRRECLKCVQRFTTYERIEFVPITVIKREGDRESFDSSKLLRGIVRACEKTGVESQMHQAIVDEIESELQQRTLREVTSAEIGDMVLQRLRPLNEVAYVRFASVYRQFQGIRDFVDTLAHLQDSSRLENTGLEKNSPENTGNENTGTENDRPDDQASHDQASHDQASHDQASHDPGRKLDPIARRIAQLLPEGHDALSATAPLSCPLPVPHAGVADALELLGLDRESIVGDPVLRTLGKPANASESPPDKGFCV